MIQKPEKCQDSMISAIAIISKNLGLGKDNKLLFHIPGELPRFKKITTGHPIIMGRKTFESLGRPLPGRTNIVITKDKQYRHPGIIIVYSLDEAIKKAQSQAGSEEIFVIGGGQVFTEAMPQTNRLYLTVVDKNSEADTFFPDYSDFKKVISKEDRLDWEVPYSFLILER